MESGQQFLFMVEQDEREEATTISNSTISNSTIGGDDWIVDSGATSHMTSKADLLTAYTKFNTPRLVRLGDGSASPAIGAGEALFKIESEGAGSVVIKLQRVLLVPDLASSLFSTIAASDNGNQVTFFKGGCEIKAADGTLVANAKRIGKLFYLKCQPFKLTVEEVAAPAAERPSFQLLHQRLGHIHEQRLKSLLKDGKVQGGNANKLDLCKGCLEGKFTKAPFKVNADRHKTTEPLQLVHTDVCGPMPVQSPGGKRFFVTFIDDWTRAAKIYFLSSKDEVLHHFKVYKAAVEKALGRSIKALRSDGGGEYVGREFVTFMQDNGIAHQRSAPHCPQQNGVAERYNRTVVEMARTMLYHAGHAKGMWAEAVAHAAYILNRLPTAATNEAPYKRWYGHQPELQHLRVWGCLGYAQVPDSKRSKLDAKSEPVRFLGFEPGIKAYRVLLLKTNRVATRRDVCFDESRFHLPSKKSKPMHPNSKGLEFDLGDGRPGGAQDDELPQWIGAEEEEETQDSTSTNPQSDAEPDDGQQEKELPTTPADETTLVASPQQPELRRSARPRRQPKRFYDEYALLAALLSTEEEPKSFADAMESSQASKWRDAAEEEIQALHLNKTWDLVQLPHGRKPVGCRWVFRLKKDDQGRIARFKARLVAKGFTQKEGVDYCDTFAPVVRFETVRTLVAYAVINGMLLHQVDVETAFLHGQLNEEIYMQQPEGFDDKSGRVCRLRRSLYGLKQSPRCWNAALHEQLLRIGFHQLAADPCVYAHKTPTTMQVLAVYVDDIVLLAKTTSELAELKRKLAAAFPVKDLGKLNFLLGVSVQHIGSSVFLSQPAYIRNMLGRFKMESAHPVDTPADANVALVLNDGYSNEVDRGGYQQVVGSLLYAAVATRPDIAQAVSTCCRYTSAPTSAHWTAVKRVLRYLSGTIDYGLYYTRPEAGGKNDLVGYCDADWAGDRDTRKSTTGHYYQLAGAAVSWVSQRQPVVALSSTEAEYVALSSAAQQAVWIRRLLGELGVDVSDPTPICEDNQGAVCLATNPVHHKKTKHIAIRHHYIRQCVADGSINLHYVPTNDMIADILTKPLPRVKFQRLRPMMGVVPISHEQVKSAIAEEECWQSTLE